MLQDIYERSAAQLYPIGMLHTRDERKFRYCEIGDATFGAPAAAATQVRNAYGVASAIRAVPIEDSVLAVAGVIGDTTITITSIGAFAANHFQGGYIGLSGGIYGACFKVRSHPASTGAGQAIVFTIDGPLGAAIALGTGSLLFRSMYADIRSPRQEAIEVVATMNARYNSFVGVPLVAGLATEFIWIQTAGPCIVCSSDGDDGDTPFDRRMAWNQDGSVYSVANPIAADRSDQIAGYLIAATQTAATPPAVGAATPDALDYIWLQCE